MPSDQRLHPVSIVFALGGTLKALALPALLVLFTSSRSSDGPSRVLGLPQGNWELWAMLMLIPAAIVALAKYLSFRLRYEESELVIRTGILFRNERHVPYARIQNLGAVRNVFHRLLGVTEVRVETGGGNEPEATISVLPLEAFDEMRQRVFSARSPRHEAMDGTGEIEPASDAKAPERILLQLPLRELVLHGIIENRGVLVIAALAGLLWEIGLAETVGDRLFGDASYGRGVVRDVVAALARGDLPLGRLLITMAVVAGAVGAVQAASIAWAVVRLHGFRLTQAGEDLRTEFGLFTRVTSTIPLRRVQTLTIYQGPLQRLASRAAIRVETAGGAGERGRESIKDREWVAPIVRQAALQDLTRTILPELDFTAIRWQPVHPRAFRRAVKGAIAASAIASLIAAAVSWWASVVLFGFLLPLAVLGARMHVRHLQWAADDHVVMFRSGWAWRRLTVARVVKIQAVTTIQTPFDRRTGMARLRVDTAGASERSHRVDVPYLPWDLARELHQRLAARAATTAFRW